MKKKSLLLILLMALLAPWAVAQQALPYSYGFEDNDLSIDGWTTQNPSGLNASEFGIYAGAAKTGSYGFRFSSYNDSGTSTQYLISPELSASKGVVVSFYYRSSSTSSSGEKFKVGYSTTDTDVSSSFTWSSEYSTKATSWSSLEETFPAGTKYIAIYYYPNYQYRLFIDDISLVVPPSCIKPTDLAATLTPGDGTVALLSWTKGGDETNWVLQYSTDSEFNTYETYDGGFTVEGSTISADLTLLTPETTYYARVKADCGGGDESDWSTTCSFQPTTKIVIGSGDATSYYLPTHTNYHFSLTQQIYTASELGEAGYIVSIDFYNTSTAKTRNLDVYMVSTSKSTFSSSTDWISVSSADLVFSGEVTFTQNAWATITLDNGFTYDETHNIAIIVDDNTDDDPGTSYMRTFEATDQALYVYSDGTNYDPTNPGSYSGTKTSVKNQIRVLKSDIPTCFKPTTLAYSEVGSRQAKLSWTKNGDETAWQICVNGDEAHPVAANANPFVLTGLEPETDYTVKVRAYCDAEDQSDWSSEVSFTTLEACPTPTSLAVSEITAYSAKVSWTSDNDNFDLRYVATSKGRATLEYGFEGDYEGWTTIDADNDGYDWVLNSETEGNYLTNDLTGSHTGSGMMVSGSYSNVTGDALNPDNYLVSPQITLGGSITFWAAAQDADYPEEHFGVAVSTSGNTDENDFTTIEEWDMTAKGIGAKTGIGMTRSGNRDQGNWYEYTVDLSAYSGQGYIAIRHFDCTDQFLLVVDDITIVEGDGGVVYDWIEVDNVSNPYTFPNNLTKETNYLVQVRSNCGGDGYSDWTASKNFKTLPSCLKPTGLVVSNVTGRTAVLAWTASGEETEWQIMLNDDEPGIINVDSNPYTLKNLEPETDYSVKVRAYCDSDDQSAWSTAASFTTDVACEASDNLEVSNIASKTATLSWESESDNFDVRYANMTGSVATYENGIQASGIYNYGNDFYAAAMFPAGTFTTNYISEVLIYDGYVYDNRPSAEIKVSVYNDGDTAPTDLIYTTNAKLYDVNSYAIIPVDASIDKTKNVWVVVKTNSLTVCSNTGDANGRWISLNGSSWGDLTSYSLNYTWQIGVYEGNALSWVNKTCSASPYNLSGLTPETDYVAQVRTNCGGIDGESAWITTYFTTLSNCPTPTGLAASNMTQNTALLSWTGSSDVDDYTVQFRTAAKINTTDPVFSETFNESSIPTGWEKKSGLLSSVMGGTALTTGGSWYFGNSNGAFNSHAYNNIYGTSRKDWLITPSITVGSKNALSFDMALTAYSGTLGAPETTGTDDKFVVLISTDDEATWTILRQWDNAGSPYIYNDIVCSATGENVLIDLSAYNGETVRIAFYGESTVYNADNDLHIDNVIVNTFTDPGTWQTAIDDVEEESFTLTGLTAETKYDAQVKSNCTSGVYCDFISFTTLAEHNIVFPETGNWTASGFEPDGAPTIEDDVIIRANVTIQNGTNAQANNINLENGAIITVASGATLTINGNVTNGGTTKLIVEDGGQLIVKKTGIYATVKKSVAHAKGVNGWYTISSPINSNYTNATSITNMIQVPAVNYDLYYYQESTRKWKNYKASSFSIAKGNGYLYWNSTGAELAFPGDMTYGDVSVTLTKNVAEPTDNLEGFNLIGNPYPHNIYKGEGTAIENSKAEGYALVTGFYTLSNSGEWLAGTDNTTAIKPAQGILVQATTAGTLTIQDKTTSGAAKANNDNIKFNVANNQFEDVTYALFMDEIGLTKINHRNADAPMIYIPQDGENYAIATMGDDTETFGLNFKAMTTGMYTLSAKADGMFSYLHVIDRLTGEDIDMLVDGKYEFIGSPRDNEARFIVKLRYNANGFNNDEFIYQNGDELIVNGEGELQVYDVMGRYVACYNVNGNKRISAEQFSNAVYIFRLVGSDVKTQKIVVR